jgi:DNA-binding transcriptional LysR family regulator
MYYCGVIYRFNAWIMTLVQLKHFVNLAECGSFVAAAKALYLTQPALTRSIQSLEEDLGQQLFDRIGRRIELTSFGCQALVQAQLLVQEADDFKHLGKQVAEGQSGRIRVGMGSGPGAVLATPLMRYMAEHHPKVQIEIARGHTDRLLHALRERELDGAIVDIRSMRPSQDLLVTNQVEMSASFMCRAGHPLLNKRKPLTIEQVLQYPLASTPLSDEVARVLTELYGPQADPDHCVTLRSDDTQTLLAVALETNAVVLTINAAGTDLVRLNVNPPMRATARFGLVTPRYRAQVPALELVSKLMTETLKDAA